MDLEETLFLYISERFWDIDALKKSSTTGKKSLQIFFCETESGNYYFCPIGFSNFHFQGAIVLQYNIRKP